VASFVLSLLISNTTSLVGCVASNYAKGFSTPHSHLGLICFATVKAAVVRHLSK